MGGWVGGCLEKWGLKLTSFKVEVEVEAELGKMSHYTNTTSNICSRYPCHLTNCYKTKMPVFQ